MIDRKHDLPITRAGGGSAHQPRQRLLSAAPGVGGRPRDHAASRPAASGVPIRGSADVARSFVGRWVQDRPSAREDADAADGDRSALSPSAHDEAGARTQDLPVPAARHRDHAAKPGVGDGHHLHPDGAWLRLPRRRARLVQPARAVVARIDHDGSGVLRRDAGGRLGSPRQAGHLQHRPRIAVHRRGLHRRTCQQPHCDQHGRQGRLAGQRLRRAAVAQRQIRGGLSAGLRQRQRGPRIDRPVPRLLQSHIGTPIWLCD